MKFLCVSCNKQMKIKETRQPEEGSIAVIFKCLGCGCEVGMLTNPYETQIVQSLNVKIGPQVNESTASTDTAIQANTPFILPWTPEAEERLQRVPQFVREMARKGVEQFARDHGYDVITEDVMTVARKEFGM